MGDIAEHDAGEHYYGARDPFRSTSIGAVIGSIMAERTADQIIADTLREREQRRAEGEALVKIAQLDRLAVNDLPDGTIVRVVKSISGKRYSYAAIRAAGRWYLTGRTSKPLGYVEFCTWLLTGGDLVDWAVQQDVPVSEEAPF